MSTNTKERGLTARQKLFAYYFVHGAEGINTKAAEMAGYKNPNPEGSRVRRIPAVQAEIDRLFAEYMTQGQTLKEVRVQSYRDMIATITSAFRMRAASYEAMGVSPFYSSKANPKSADNLSKEEGLDPEMEKIGQNAWLLESVPHEAITGMYLRKVSVTGSGTRIVEWVFDYHAVKELREWTKQLAIELGSWTINQNVTGTMSIQGLRELAASAAEDE